LESKKGSDPETEGGRAIWNRGESESRDTQATRGKKKECCVGEHKLAYKAPGMILHRHKRRGEKRQNKEGCDVIDTSGEKQKTRREIRVWVKRRGNNGRERNEGYMSWLVRNTSCFTVWVVLLL